MQNQQSNELVLFVFSRSRKESKITQSCIYQIEIWYYLNEPCSDIFSYSIRMQIYFFTTHSLLDN